MNGLWKVIRILYFALLIGTLTYLIFAVLFTENVGLGIHLEEELLGILNSIALVFAFVAYFVVRFINKFQLKKLDLESSSQQKLNWYKTTFIMELMVLQFASATIITLFLISSSLLSLTPLLLTVGYMLILRPDIHRAANLLNLTVEEIEEVPNVV